MNYYLVKRDKKEQKKGVYLSFSLSLSLYIYIYIYIYIYKNKKDVLKEYYLYPKSKKELITT